jgi:DNA end-binding protein Ku
MRSTWKGNITFGLVNIPIAVYPATREEKVAFKQLRKKDLSPIRYKKVAEVDEEEVPSDQIVKGFEYEKGKWVVLEDKDFEEVQIESTHTIEITDFIDASEVNPKYFYKPYFLEPQKGGEKAYALLHRALIETGRIGIAKVAIRSREYLAGVKPDGLFIMLELMHFSHEILEPEGLKSPFGTELSAKELSMAKTLIETLSGEWEPEKYVDQYQDAMKELIDRKVQHLPAASKPAPAKARGDYPDILAILQQSIAQGTDKRKKSGERPVRPKSTASLLKQRRSAGAAKN